MRRILVAIGAGALWTTLWAQAPRSPERLSAWQSFREAQVPRVQAFPAGLLDFVLDGEMLDRTRADGTDIRLYNGSREIPYVFRVRREIDTSKAFPAREFNRSTEGGVTQVSYDLGEQPQQHNQVEIEMSGDNFRRLVDVQGSSDGVQWSTLVSGAIAFRFTARGRTVEQKSVEYPVSRYRYLRIRVDHDAQVDRAAPELKAAEIFRSVKVKGEMVSFRGGLEQRDSDRLYGRPASIWRVDFGARIPLEHVVLTMGSGVFSRPYQLDAIDDPASPTLLASGTLYRSEDQPDTQLTIEFPERFARRVKLTVTDDRNTPLPILEFTAQSAAREVVFGAQSAGEGPIRVFYGNRRAMAPRYDLAARLPAELRPAPVRLTLGPERENPIYRPEPRPFSERSPWLVYVVLGAASLALAAILLSLVRASRGDGGPTPGSQTPLPAQTSHRL
jgi:hypothetical protein